MNKDDLFDMIDWPSIGNADILFLLTPPELVRRWLQIFGKAKKQDRTFVLPSYKTIRKCLVHRDYKLYLMGLKGLGELQEFYNLKPFLLERLYLQREKEIREERKDKDHQAIRTGLTKILEAGKKQSRLGKAK